MKRLLLAGLSLSLAFLTRADFNPVALTPGSFTQDIIVEKSAAAPLVGGYYTTASMDGGVANTGYSWYERGYYLANLASGLPPAGTIFTSVSAPDHQFLMPPSYVGSNNA